MERLLDLTSLESYAESCRRLAERDFGGLSPARVAEMSEDYNAYPGLESLGEPRGLICLEERLDDSLLDRARQAVLEGRIFWEHTAAGEATRLKLGPKYLIHPHRVPLVRGHLADSLLEPAHAAGDDAADWARFEGRLLNPQRLMPLPLGARHLWQWVFEISRLAEEAGLKPSAVLARQQILLIVGEQTRAEIVRRVQAADFLGLPPENFLFMVQATFPGLRPGPEGWRFDPETPGRLHNHGQMAMQKTMEGQIFHLDREGGEHRLSRDEYFQRLAGVDDMVSYNIEDLDYLTRALDFETIGLALSLADEGYGMTMEIVANNPEHPVKGGLCAYDPALGRDVVIESFRLRGLAPADIKFLNKNFNHYPQPALLFERLNREGLFMPVKVEDEAVYFQPVQGDLNFLTRTAFITRRRPRPLRSWKSAEDSPAALTAMAQQDAQPGFAEFVHCRTHRES